MQWYFASLVIVKAFEWFLFRCIIWRHFKPHLQLFSIWWHIGFHYFRFCSLPKYLHYRIRTSQQSVISKSTVMRLFCRATALEANTGLFLMQITCHIYSYFDGILSPLAASTHALPTNIPKTFLSLRCRWHISHYYIYFIKSIVYNNWLFSLSHHHDISNTHFYFILFDMLTSVSAFTSQISLEANSKPRHVTLQSLTAMAARIRTISSHATDINISFLYHIISLIDYINLSTLWVLMILWRGMSRP